MAISTNWVNDYVDIKDVDLKELADKITKAGINIEAVNSKYINNLVIGEVVECYPHPDSDHLNVCKVNVGTDTRQIVCGASNVRAGLKVIVSLPGAVLPGNFEIKKGVIRGEESNGMICALSEIGLEEETPETRAKGIYELPSDAEVGSDASIYMGLDDTSYELDLNPNRNDVKNHIPFSYEVAAVLNRKVTLPETTYNEIDDSVKNHMNLKIETENCTMYNLKMVTDVTIKESPSFIKERLETAGMRSINNVVDISNYIMLEYGQPLHFFDKDKVGDTILVRMASDGETIVTLDEKERTLTSEDIVITDGTKPICIAGVMGGNNSGIDENTKTIAIESAIFNAYNVRYTSIRNDLRSEASLRYEKGLNYEYCNLAIERACHLLEKYADAKVLKDIITHDTIDKTENTVDFTMDDINAVLGIELTKEDAISSLNGLGFEYTLDKDNFHVIIPSRRLDVEPRVNDLAEEIGRLYGYEKIEGKLPVCETKSGKYIGRVKIRKLVSKRLRTLGLNEARTYTLVSDEMASLFNYRTEEKIKLLRPMSEDKKVIRTTIIPSLLNVYEYNKSHSVKDINVYEIANIYYNESEEDTLVSALISGNYNNANFQGNAKKSDFYVLKGIVCNMLDCLGFNGRYEFVKGDTEDLHPGQNANILIDKEKCGIIGKIHPKLTEDDVYVFELSLKKIDEKKVRAIKFKELPKFPSIVKDVAFVVDKDTESKSIEMVIKKAGGKLLTNVKVFDVYTGEKLEDGKKSIAYSLTFNDEEKTLTDEVVMELFNKIINEVNNKFSGEIRNK